MKQWVVELVCVKCRPGVQETVGRDDRIGGDEGLGWPNFLTSNIGEEGKSVVYIGYLRRLLRRLLRGSCRFPRETGGSPGN